MSHYSILATFLKNRLTEIFDMHNARITAKKNDLLTGILTALGTKTNKDTILDPKETFRWLLSVVKQGSDTEGFIMKSDDLFVTSLKELLFEVRNKLCTDSDEGLKSVVVKSLGQSPVLQPSEKAMGASQLQREYQFAIAYLNKNPAKISKYPLTDIDKDVCMTILEFLKVESEELSPSLIASSSSPNHNGQINSEQEDADALAEIRATIKLVQAQHEIAKNAADKAQSQEDVEQVRELARTAKKAADSAQEQLEDARDKANSIWNKDKKSVAKELIKEISKITKETSGYADQVKDTVYTKQINQRDNQAHSMQVVLASTQNELSLLKQIKTEISLMLQQVALEPDSLRERRTEIEKVTGMTLFFKPIDHETLKNIIENAFLAVYKKGDKLSGATRNVYNSLMFTILAAAQNTADATLKSDYGYLYTRLCFAKNGDLEGTIKEILNVFDEKGIVLDQGIVTSLKKLRNADDLGDRDTLCTRELKLMAVPFQATTTTTDGKTIKGVFSDQDPFKDAYAASKTNNPLLKDNLDTVISNYAQNYLLNRKVKVEEVTEEKNIVLAPTN